MFKSRSLKPGSQVWGRRDSSGSEQSRVPAGSQDLQLHLSWVLGLSIWSHHRPGQVSSARQSPWDSLGCRLYDFRVAFSLCSCSPNAWGPNVLGQIAQLSVLVLGSMPAPVAVRGFCVTLTGGDRRTDLARNLFLKNSRFKAIPSMLSLSIACLQC